MKVAFIGLGNVGGKLAGCLLRNGFQLTVRDLERDLAQPFLDQGAEWGESPRQMAEKRGHSTFSHAACEKVECPLFPPLELSPLLLDIFRDGQQRYGSREWSPNIVRRLEEACEVDILGSGFPAEMVDDEPEEPGYEVAVTGR